MFSSDLQANFSVATIVADAQKQVNEYADGALKLHELDELSAFVVVSVANEMVVAEAKKVVKEMVVAEAETFAETKK